MVMRRFGLLILVLAAAVGLSAQARAATVITLDEGGATDALGPGVWEVLIQSPDSNAAINNGGQFGLVNGLAFSPNAAVCDNNNLVICAGVPGGDVDASLAGTLYMIIAVNTLNMATGGSFLLGTVDGNNLQPTANGLEIVAGTPEYGFSAPVTFDVRPIPEPAAIAFLGLGFASLAFLRRRAA
jgi:hypothetical protein